MSRHAVSASTRVLVAMFTLSVGLSLTACGGGGTGAGDSKAAKPATEAPDLANETYHGIDYANGPLTLSKGRWEAPVDTTLGIGASAEWDADMSASGDLDGDGVQEHLSLLRVSGGGSGTFNYLALFGARGGAWTQLGRAIEIGDRLQFVTPPAMDSGLVRIMVVTHGADDPMCCPGDLALRRWRPGPEGLVELPVQTMGRLAVGMVRMAPMWRLVSWGEGEPVPQGFEVTLAYGEGRFSGSGGCNRYTVPVQDAQTTPGSLELGAVGSSRRACPEPTAGLEARYLQALAGVTQMVFLDGRLGLVYEVQGTYGTLVFEPGEEFVD